MVKCAIHCLEVSGADKVTDQSRALQRKLILMSQ
jgi:hypothetical protein